MHLTNQQIKIILNGCRLNERWAQKELYRNYYSYAMSIAFQYSYNYDNAVEITNDTFLKIYKDLQILHHDLISQLPHLRHGLKK